MARRGMSGAALLVAAAGVVLVFSGLRNTSPLDVLRAALRGKAIPSGPETVVGTRRDDSAGGGGGSATGAAAVAAARKYLGIKYVFGAHEPSKGFDCSGLVTYVLHHDLGIDIDAEGSPGNNVHTVTSQWYVWTGADTVGWDDMQPGDLVCWMSHIGIAVGDGTMIHAPHTGAVVRINRIWRTPEPIIRRPKAYGANVMQPRGGSGQF